MGVIGLGVGTAFAIAGSGDADELDRLGYDGTTGTCRVDLSRCKASYDAAATAAAASTALWIAGGALVAIGIPLIALGGGDAEGDDGDAVAERRAAPHLALRLLPGGGLVFGRY